MLSFERSLRLSVVISTTALEPAGITTPFDPMTGSAICAVKRSPTELVFVQTLCPEESDISEPADTVPSARSDPRGSVVTVLPLDVTALSPASGAAGAALGADAGRTTVLRTGGGAAARARTLGAGSTSTTAGTGSASTGTSCSCG